MSVALSRTAASTQSMTERTRRLLTLKNFHIAGVALLALVCVYLLVQMLTAWRAAKSDDAAAVAQQTVEMRQAEIAARPLAGLDEKLKQATADSDEFYAKRLPYSYSEFVVELGVLAKRENVKLDRVQYSAVPVLEDGIAPLTEVRMDASLTGDYRPLAQFVNGLERDKRFFLIGAVALTGQQSGSVGVRLRITTYLRTPLGTEATDKSVANATEGEATGSGPSSVRTGGMPR